MQKIYKAVVFDFGGVIFKYDGLRKIREELAAKHNIDPKTIQKLSTDISEFGRSLFRGTLSTEELEKTVLPDFFEKKLNIKLTERVFYFEVMLGEDAKNNLNGCMLTAISKLREQGYKTALLTNNFHLDEQKKLNRVPVNRNIFDVMVESAVEGEIKPEPKIYQITQSRLGDIKPEEVVFLDDLAENLVYPKQMGWNTIHVDPLYPEKAVEELEKILETSLH